MKFTKLRLTGFKSFVEAAELWIEPGLTGIVGPNGCGKSNLLEAMRWVMGESSARSMRGAGMEDVIFAGTSTRAPRDFAEVALTVERGEPEGGSEAAVEVVRRIERGAGSAYRINGSDVRARDVALLFADAATGAHSPALVGQGRINAIIAARPAERRQMLEEAAGIAGLHVRRKDAEQKLRAAEANLIRLDDVLAEMEVRAATLRRQARAAERYRDLSDRIRTAEARSIYARWRDASSAADAAQKEIAAAEAALGIAWEAQQSAAAHQAQQIRLLGEARAEAQAARDAEAALRQDLAVARNERTAVLRRIDETRQRRETLAADLVREDKLARDAAEAIARLEAEDRTLAASVGEAEGQEAGAAARVAEAAEALRAGELALAQALATEAARQADLRVAEAALASATQRLARAVQDTTRVAAELAALGDGSGPAADLSAARKARAAAEADIAVAQAALEAGEQARASAATARDEAEAALSVAKASLAAIESEAAALRRALASGASAGKADRLIAHLRVDPGYERALAAALDDDLEAPVGATGARRWQGAHVQPGDPVLPDGVRPLADHVAAPPELARRLAQIGVVDADDGGISLAVGQRLVTRDGVMRRWDGYVTTGSGAGAAERLIRANRLKELDDQLEGARAAVEAAGAALAEAEAVVRSARDALERARAARATADTALRTALRNEDMAQAAIDRHAGAKASLAGRAERATAEEREARAEDERCRDALAALPPLDDIRATVATLRTDNEGARRALAEAQAIAGGLARSLDADRRRREAIRSEIRGWRARAGDAARRVEEMRRRLAEAEADATALQDEPARFELAIAAFERDLADASARAASAQESEKAAGARLSEIEAAAAQAGEALATAREARAGAAARFEYQDQRRTEMSRLAGERFGGPAVVLPGKAGFTADDVGEAGDEAAIHDRLAADRERLGPVNLVAEAELSALEQERTTGQAEREELGQAINRLRGSIGSLNREGRQRLLAAFEAVNGHFKRLFTTLFIGGEAHLALVDSDDPLEAGLEIMAQPPGKRLGSLTLLSGGEQALTAVALIFALFLTNPAPICVLDEVDAPLDDANIERFCDLLDQMTRETDTRYLIVTHNAVTMSRMHRLFGVTMVERGISRLVSVDLGGAAELQAAE